MDRVKYLKKPKIYIVFAVAIIVTIFFFPNEGRFKYSYQRGKPWIYETLIAPMDFPILKTNAELLAEKEEKASIIIQYYNYDESIYNAQIHSITSLLSNNNLNSAMFQDIVETLSSIYEKGIVSEYDSSFEKGVIIVQKDKRATEIPSSEVYDVKYATNYIKYKIAAEFPSENVDSIFNKYNIDNYIIPNLIFDENKTDLIHREAVDYISPTKGMIYTGQLIVSEGEIVTSEVAQLLDSYKEEYESSFGFTGSFAGLITGHIIIVFIVFSLFFATLYFINIKVFANFNQYLFLMILQVIIFIVTVLINHLDPKLLYLFPYAVFAIYMVSFFKQSLAFPLYGVMLLPLLLLSSHGLELYFINILAGAISLVSFYYFNRGWLQFINSVFIFIGLLLAYMAFILLSDGSLATFDTRILFFLACNSLFVVAAYPIVFLFEKMFSLVSNSKLKDLADTNNKLLLELARKAPGTFQHSLQVANLADTAAREIGGDVMLVKVGALYHDIGKMRNPQCFVENEPVGMNYHKGLAPIESARQIIRHVGDGVELAKKAKLPSVVIDFIKTHHARTVTAYFYNVYCNNGGDPENKEPFTYKGDLPTTKEQVIVLMADAVEAASRTLKAYNEESISTLVESIISKRLSDSQLVNADISIREITIVKEIFKQHLLQVYHARIIYPDRKG